MRNHRICMNRLYPRLLATHHMNSWVLLYILILLLTKDSPREMNIFRMGTCNEQRKKKKSKKLSVTLSNTKTVTMHQNLKEVCSDMIDGQHWIHKPVQDGVQ